MNEQQRKKPEYGEYAPDYEPDAHVSDTPVSDKHGSGGPDSGDAAGGGRSLPQGSSARIEGVPHNLGVSGASTSAVTSSAGASSAGAGSVGTSYGGEGQTTQEQPQDRPAVPTAPANAPPRQSQQPPQPQFQLQQSQPQQNRLPASKRERSVSSVRADRIISIVLLVIGAFGALNLAMGAMDIGRQLYLIADAVGVPDASVPAGIKTLETVTAILILSVYAVTLLLSIHRLRNKKLTFWVPLVGAVVAFLILTIAMAISFAMVPEVMGRITPENIDSIMSSLMQP